MAESELAKWAAEVSDGPYADRVYAISRAITMQTVFRLADVRTEGLEYLQTLSLIHISEPTRPY